MKNSWLALIRAQGRGQRKEADVLQLLLPRCWLMPRAGRSGPQDAVLSSTHLSGCLAGCRSCQNWRQDTWPPLAIPGHPWPPQSPLQHAATQTLATVQELPGTSLGWVLLVVFPSVGVLRFWVSSQLPRCVLGWKGRQMWACFAHSIWSAKSHMPVVPSCASAAPSYTACCQPETTWRQHKARRGRGLNPWSDTRLDTSISSVLLSQWHSCVRRPHLWQPEWARHPQKPHHRHYKRGVCEHNKLVVCNQQGKIKKQVLKMMVFNIFSNGLELQLHCQQYLQTTLRDKQQ